MKPTLSPAQTRPTDNENNENGHGLTDYLLSVARGRRGVMPALLRGVMGVLAPVYCAGLKAYLLQYDIGIRHRLRLPCKVISIGNLTTGGTGKTPMTQTLCRALVGEDPLHPVRKVAILSRGYGGKFERGCAVVSDGHRVRLNAQEAGDEAYLLARTLPEIPVLIGKDRRATGQLAVEQFQPDVLVLDDGMQYWQLHRDLDIVLLNACEPFDNGYTFPRGLLREPPTHLRRAGIVVLTNTRRAGEKQVAAVIAYARQLAPGKPIYRADLAPYGLRDVVTREALDCSWLDGRRVAALSAIGNPSSFESMIGELGGVLSARFRFRDHQAIPIAELDRVGLESCATGAEAIVTTEKDAVKMPPLKNALPLLALQVAMQMEAEAEFLSAVEEAISNTEPHQPV